MCKPYKRGCEDKKTVGDLRAAATRHEQEIGEFLSDRPLTCRVARGGAGFEL
jgi:hypothetical protein